MLGIVDLSVQHYSLRFCICEIDVMDRGGQSHPHDARALPAGSEDSHALGYGVGRFIRRNEAAIPGIAWTLRDVGITARCRKTSYRCASIWPRIFP